MTIKTYKYTKLFTKKSKSSVMQPGDIAEDTIRFLSDYAMRKYVSDMNHMEKNSMLPYTITSWVRVA